VLVTAGILSQSRELRAAATTDIDAYVAANDAALTVSNMRVTEISAVASHGSGAPLYEEVQASAADLVAQLDDGELRSTVQQYADTVEEVRATDLDDGDNRAAADNTLGDDPEEGSSADRFETANTAATEAVGEASDALNTRFDAASDAQISPLVPIALGLVAAGLAAAGTLARARRYR